jgi:hypothetical protein
MNYICQPSNLVVVVGQGVLLGTILPVYCYCEFHNAHMCESDDRTDTV